MKTERDEFEAQDELRARRKEIKDLDDLFKLIEDVKDNYNTGYGVAPRAIAQAAVATASYLLSEMGCTGFQASCCMWDFIRDLIYINNKTGLRIMNYDDLLYPQYEYKFLDRTISKKQWETLQQEAQKALDERDLVCFEVYAHWKNIVEGKVPFGFSVKE